ncbi:hypothetical protein RhiXN_00225 [Rhizoctonia solani]|uniref:Uncharacterized protein n=1 Tax=Rhizoctonia solani TaxID=456999 RepID=A0A8H8SUU0_9AGAM|nr:uncharacterized protein RhiXN_00225 [Rhizoctonia solani]QRW18819.1 hypothetical protein RhiXN_00225 [Rhizoctonia solani]
MYWFHNIPSPQKEMSKAQGIYSLIRKYIINAQVLYLDFDPSNPSHTQVRSASNTMFATDLAVVDAAGASAAEHPHLYVISTGELGSKGIPENDPKLALHDYRERLSAAAT